jgi:hypothetical protein
LKDEVQHWQTKCKFAKSNARFVNETHDLQTKRNTFLLSSPENGYDKKEVADCEKILQSKTQPQNHKYFRYLGL